MHVRAQWADNDNGAGAENNPWLEYERRKSELVEHVVEVRATGTEDVTRYVMRYRGVTAREYESAILALCEELKL